jgi:hypothetical protein
MLSNKPYASTATVERLIVGKAVDHLLMSCLGLSVETGDQTPLLAESDDADSVVAAALASADGEAWLFTPNKKHFVKLVLGNGLDVISDFHIDLNAALKAANDLAAALEA